MTLHDFMLQNELDKRLNFSLGITIYFSLAIYMILFQSCYIVKVAIVRNMRFLFGSSITIFRNRPDTKASRRQVIILIWISTNSWKDIKLRVLPSNWINPTFDILTPAFSTNTRISRLTSFFIYQNWRTFHILRFH